MKYNFYLENCPPVSEIGFGAWQIGKSNDWESISDGEAYQLIYKALDLGINYFDTAPNYGYGSSEERLGHVINKIDRDKIVINTKFGHNTDGTLNFSPDNIRKSLEGSLKRLKTEYVDSLIIHNPPFELLDGNKNPHYEILERLIEDGKIKAYGASLDSSKEINTLINSTNSKVVEAFFNIFHQDSRKAFKNAKDNGVSIVVKVPLDSGWLSGKYSSNSSFEDIRKRWSQNDINTRAKLVEIVKNIIGVDNSLSKSAIAFCLKYDAVSTVIPGNKNLNQLIQNAASSEEIMPSQIVHQLEQLYKEKIEQLKIPW